jgi:predicted nucleic acid-binding protein
MLRHYLGKEAKVKTPELASRVGSILAAGPHLSIVSAYELDRWCHLLTLRGGGQQKRRILELWMSEAIVYDMTRPVWGLAAFMHAQAATKNITFGESDLLILATAVVHGRRVLTTDTSFSRNAGAVGVAASIELVALA